MSCYTALCGGGGRPRTPFLATIASILSLLLSLLAITFTLLMFPGVFQALVNTQVLLTPGTMSFTQWLAPTPLVYRVATVYNLTNPKEMAAGKAPRVEALGPYYYREYREKINVVVPVDAPEELWFEEKKWYEFDTNKTNANRSGMPPLNPFTDKFTTINIAYVGVVYNLTLTNAPKWEVAAVVAAAAMKHEAGLTMTKTVNEVIFGYEDQFLEILRLQMPDLPTTVQLLYNMSQSDITRRSVVDSGKSDVGELGQYREWQGMEELPWWGDEQANTINGTEGLFFAPGLTSNQTLSIWADDMYRSIIMEYERSEECLGLDTFKYKTPGYSMLNATQNPNNAGFYSYCPSGLMNLTSAVRAPIMLSKPSFLGGEDWLREEVSGLPPLDPATMDTNIWVEPHTGLLVKANKQLQINIMISQAKLFPGLITLRGTPRYVPIALIKETGGLDDDLLAQFHTKVTTPRGIALGLLWGAAGVFLAVSLVCAVAVCVVGMRARGVDEESTDDPLLKIND